MTRFPSALAATCLAASCGPILGPVVPETATERKMINLLEKFDLWDEDGSGDLDLAELTRGLRGSGHPPEDVLDFYDTNRNGRITLGEAQEAYHRAEEADQRIQKRLDGGR